MKAMFSTATCAAAVLALGIAAFAQTTTQAPAQSQTKPPVTAQPSSSPGDQAVTVTGCIQAEADYRKAHNLRQGGVAGTGIGAANEFVLVNATMSGGGAGAPVGTAGAADTAYELTGKNEGQAATFLGRRVEIAGMLKATETRAGAPTGGPTAGTPPRGVDATSDDLKLRELEVTSVKAASGNCTP